MAVATTLPPPQPIPRVSSLSREDFERDFLLPARPVIVEGGVGHWPACSAWRPEPLKQKLAGRRVRVACSEGDVFGYTEQPAYSVEEMEAAEAVDLISRARPSARRYYLMQQVIPKEFPELMADLPDHEYLGGARAQPQLWFGTEGNVSPLHYDMVNNLFGQLYGRKRFLLYDPGQSDLVYPRAGTSKHHNISLVDAESPDLEKFPRFAEARAWSCEVGPGDLLFQPAFWWHQVRSLEVSMSVTVLWAPRAEQFLAPMARRMVPVLYERDRLLTFKGLTAQPGPYQGFLGMARLMLEHGHSSEAVLFAMAALEDGLRLVYMKHVKPPDTTALRDAARMTAALAAAGQSSEADAAAVAGWTTLARAALAEQPVDAEAARAVADGVGPFLARHKR